VPCSVPQLLQMPGSVPLPPGLVSQTPGLVLELVQGLVPELEQTLAAESFDQARAAQTVVEPDHLAVAADRTLAVSLAPRKSSTSAPALGRR